MKFFYQKYKLMQRDISKHYQNWVTFCNQKLNLILRLNIGKKINRLREIQNVYACMNICCVTSDRTWWIAESNPAVLFRIPFAAAIHTKGNSRLSRFRPPWPFFDVYSMVRWIRFISISFISSRCFFFVSFETADQRGRIGRTIWHPRSAHFDTNAISCQS